MDNGLRHRGISNRKSQLWRKDNDVNNGERPTYTLSLIRRPSIPIKLDQTINTDNYLNPQQANLLENVIEQHGENINIMNYRIHKRKKALSKIIIIIIIIIIIMIMRWNAPTDMQLAHRKPLCMNEWTVY